MKSGIATKIPKSGMSARDLSFHLDDAIKALYGHCRCKYGVLLDSQNDDKISVSLEDAGDSISMKLIYEYDPKDVYTFIDKERGI
jgi:hypothetical protein